MGSSALFLLSMIFTIVSLNADMMLSKGKRTFSVQKGEFEIGKEIVPKNGRWEIRSGLLVGTELPEDHHDGSFRVFHDLKKSHVVEIEFKFNTNREFSMSMLGGGQGQVAHVNLEHMWYRVKSGKTQNEARVYGYKRIELNPEEVHLMRLEVHDDKMLCTIDDKYQMLIVDETIKFEQTSLAICTTKGEVEIHSIQVWDGENYNDTILQNHQVPKMYTLSQHKFLTGDIDKNEKVNIDEFKTMSNPKMTEAKVLELFAKKDKNKDSWISYAEWNN